MAIGAAPDYKAALSSFLLRLYFKGLSDPRFSATEQMESRTGLELEIERLSAFSPRTIAQLALAVDQLFSFQADYSAVAPAIAWYVDFLSGRNTNWMSAVSVGQLVRMWESLPDSPLRDKIIRTIMLVDLLNDPMHPEHCAIQKVFADAEGITEGEELTGDCKTIASILIHEALASPESTTFELAEQNVRYFSLRVLRFCLTAKAGGNRARQRRLAEFALREVGDLGLRRATFELDLFVP